MMDIVGHRAFFFAISTFWTVGTSGALSGVVVSIVGFVESLPPPSQPNCGAMQAQPTIPTIKRRMIFQVIRSPLKRMVGKKQVKTTMLPAHWKFGGRRNPREQQSSERGEGSGILKAETSEIANSCNVTWLLADVRVDNMQHRLSSLGNSDSTVQS